MDKMYVKEWLHHNAKRNVKIKFGPDEAFHLMNRKGEKLRSVSVKGIENLVCEVTQVILTCDWLDRSRNLNTDL